jgi:Cu/Ag efflux pump CusA
VFSGLTVGFLFEEQKMNEVVVWSAPEARHSLSNLSDMWVGRSDRHLVRLGDVATVSVVPTPTVLRHESIAPYVDVVANVAGRDLGSVAKDVDGRLGRIQFPLEHNPQLLGEYAERLNAQQRMFGVSVAVVIGILLLMQACFGSWRLALIAFLALPAAGVGGVLAALAGGGGISLGSMVGFLAVLGIAARNGLLLINHYQCLEREGMPFGRDLVIRGARERLSPIVASSAAMIAALLPLVFMGKIAGLEVLQPTAIVIIGGLLVSTVITLFVMPALYLLAGSGMAQQPDLDLTAHNDAR